MPKKTGSRGKYDKLRARVSNALCIKKSSARFVPAKAEKALASSFNHSEQDLALYSLQMEADWRGET
jgi:hypothetical protein